MRVCICVPECRAVHTPFPCGEDCYSLSFSFKDQNVLSTRVDSCSSLKQSKVNQILHPSGINQGENSVVFCGKRVKKIFARLLHSSKQVLVPAWNTA